MSFVLGMIAVLLVDQFRMHFFKEYHIQRIAYELLPRGQYWNFHLSEAEKKEYLARATTIYNITQG